MSQEFGDRDINQITSDEILSYLNRITGGNKPYTKRVRYAQLSSFFNFIRNNIDLESTNPCDSPMVRKIYRERIKTTWEIVEKETVDEIIFRTTKPRNRLILELMARGGMRIGEVLKLTLDDIEDRKLLLREPKSGKEHEVVFIPQKLANRLYSYAIKACHSPADRIFPISYKTARMMVVQAGKMVGIHLRPHDLRRHAATFASRSGVPIEIISKVILHHANFCPPHSDTWGQSAIRKRFDGLKTFMGKKPGVDPLPDSPHTRELVKAIDTTISQTWQACT